MKAITKFSNYLLFINFCSYLIFYLQCKFHSYSSRLILFYRLIFKVDNVFRSIFYRVSVRYILDFCRLWKDLLIFKLLINLAKGGLFFPRHVIYYCFFLIFLYWNEDTTNSSSSFVRGLMLCLFIYDMIIWWISILWFVYCLSDFS